MRLRAKTVPLPSKLSTVTNASRSTVTTPDSDRRTSLLNCHSYGHSAGPSQTYAIYQTLKPNYTVLDSDGLPIYHVATKGLHPSSPHLTMYAGKNTSGPIVAFIESSRAAAGSGSGWAAKLVRGDPSNAHNAIWEDLRRIDRWSGVRYRFERAVVDVSGYVLRKGFLWKRTRAHTVDADLDVNATIATREQSTRTRKSYKLVDEETRQVLAVFSVDLRTGARRLGKMRFLSERYGITFRMMTVLSGLAVKDWENSSDIWSRKGWTL